MRWLGFLYGVAAYAAFGVVMLATMVFLAGVGPLGIDHGPAAPLMSGLAIDFGLLALFGLSHSLMARPWFKQRWTRVVPVAIERSTYVWVSSLSIGLIVWQWQPLPDVVWDVGAPALRAVIWAVACLGIALVVLSTFLIDHADLFGLRQVWLLASGQSYTPTPFRERGLYKLVRHPLMLGFFVWFWAAPTMSIGHLVFALVLSAYIVIGVRLEERDLARQLGDSYLDYRRRVRAFVPLPRRRA